MILDINYKNKAGIVSHFNDQYESKTLSDNLIFVPSYIYPRQQRRRGLRTPSDLNIRHTVTVGYIEIQRYYTLSHVRCLLESVHPVTVTS